MCGIAGVFAFRGSDFRASEEYVTRMRETVHHRGPDGGRTWVSDDGAVGLGFRRLAIVDLDDAAMQPMANEDGTVRLLFNGEVYNHPEIRRELEATGRHAFRTDHSDTETVVHAYEEWGIDCLRRFRGMFALAIWDGRTRELWLVRDRMGIKPLFYSAAGGKLAFGSEIKTILADPSHPRRIDAQAVYHYLSFLTAPAPLTFFADIKKLAAGSWLRVSEDGRMEERVWWDPWDHVEPIEGASDEELAERVLAELRTSVELRKMSDRPVGIFLSGGIDSSTNAALFADGEAQPVRTFSIGYDAHYESYPSELPYARLMAEEIGADHHERIVSLDDLIAFLPELVRLQDEPIADPVSVPLYYLSELARQNDVIVAQAGEGADELFWGYPSWRTHLRLQRADDLPVPAYAKRAGLAALAAVGRDRTRPYEFLRRGAEGIPVFWGGAEAFTETQKQRLLGPVLRDEVGDLSSWDALAPIRRRFDESAWDASPLNWMTYLDLRLRLPELLLARIDRMSMGVGLEVRVPFLDHRLVELALSIPADAKTRGGLKHILKRAVRGVIPDELIDRPKQGFRVPVDEWFMERLGDTARAEVGAFAEASGLIDADESRRILAEPRRDAWYLLNLALWWKHAIE